MQRKLLFGLVFLAGSALPLKAATWTGGGEDLYWSSVANWNTEASPFGTRVAFEGEGTTTRDQVSSVVNVSGTVSSLTFNQNGTGESDWYVLDIQENVVLTVNGSNTNSVFIVGGGDAVNSPGRTTRVAIQGAGELVVNKSTGNFGVYNGGLTNNPGYVEFDLSGLSKLTANVGNFNVGTDGGGTAVLRLADVNVITGTNFRFTKTSTRSNVPPDRASHVYLGRENTFNVQYFMVAAEDMGSANPQKGSGIIEFANRTNNSTLTIRGMTGGTSRANMLVGYSVGGSASGESVLAVADFRGGSIDALLEILYLGFGNIVASDRTSESFFYMDQGTVDANEVRIGRSEKGSTNPAGSVIANLVVEGGIFAARELYIGHNESGGARVSGSLTITGGAVTVDNGITMGIVGASGTASSVQGTIDLGGGTLSVGGNISRGTNAAQVTTTVKVSGGVLDLNGNQINVDTLSFTGGTIQNLGEFNGGASLVKTGTGSAVLAGVNQYTGATLVSGGSLELQGTLAHTQAVEVQSGASLRGSGSINASATVTVKNGGVLAPSTGGLNLGSLVMEEGSTLSIALQGETHGHLVSSQSITLEGGNLELSLNFAPSLDTVFTLIKNESGQAIDGTFAFINGMAIAPNLQFELEYGGTAYLFALSYTGSENALTGGYDLAIQVIAVPEISAGALVMLGLGLCCARGKRRFLSP